MLNRYHRCFPDSKIQQQQIKLQLQCTFFEFLAVAWFLRPNICILAWRPFTIVHWPPGPQSWAMDQQRSSCFARKVWIFPIWTALAQPPPPKCAVANASLQHSTSISANSFGGHMCFYSCFDLAMPKFGSVRFFSLLARTGTGTAVGVSRTEPEPGLNRQNRFFQFSSSSVPVWTENRGVRILDNEHERLSTPIYPSPCFRPLQRPLSSHLLQTRLVSTKLQSVTQYPLHG